MSAITQALGSGYNAKQILSYLSQHNPKLAAQVSSALNAGHTLEHVLNFISRNEKKLGKLAPEKIQQGNIYKQAQSSIHPSLTGMAKFAGTAALAAGGAFALSRAAPQILQRGLAAGANPPIQPTQTMMPQNTGTAPNSNLAPLGNSNASQLQQTQLQGINQAQQPPISNQVAPNIAQPQQVTQPEGIINPREYLEKLGIKDKVDDLLKRGNSPEQAAATLGMQRGSGKVTGQIDPELLANIDAYSKEILKNEAMQPEGSLPIPKKETVQPVDEFIEEEDKKAFAGEKSIDLQKRLKIGIPEAQRLIEERDKHLTEEKPTIEKGSSVSSPQGIGVLKELRNGQALIDIDGKLHKVKEEELEASPLPEKDLADLYDELIQGIEHETGEDVSRMVQWAGYNPETNTLQFLPHTGKLYKYGNISAEDAALLTDILSTRKTSGENFIGAWKAGSKSPIGAALSKLIRKLQNERGGKGQEYEETHEPIYSAYEPAIQAAKKKKKKK